MSWRDLDLDRLFTLDVDRGLEYMTTSYTSALLFLMMAEAFDYRSFLEIGTGGGYVSMVIGRYFELRGGGRVHTCDPEGGNIINEQEWRKAEVKFFNMTSKDYFVQLPANTKFDLIFIDGDHAIADEDFELSFPHLSEFGTIVLHDLISIPTVAKFVYGTLSKRSNLEVLGLSYQTGYSLVRRRANWEKLLSHPGPGHQVKRWIDLDEL